MYCIQSSEGCRPRDATREHPNTHQKAQQPHCTTFTIVHCKVDWETESKRFKWEWEEKVRKKQSRRKLRTRFLNFTSFIPILLYPVILTNVTQATRVLLCILLHWRDCLFWKKLHKKHKKFKICSRKSSRKSCYNQTLNITRRAL